jgi:hypothetical protein
MRDKRSAAKQKLVGPYVHEGAYFYMPEFLHIREPDGSITSKRTGDCGLCDFERYQVQVDPALEAQKARVNRLGELIRHWRGGVLPWSAVEEYWAEIQPVVDEFMLLYGADVDECAEAEERFKRDL